MNEATLFVGVAALITWVGLVLDSRMGRSPMAPTRARSRAHAHQVARSRYMAHEEIDA